MATIQDVARKAGVAPITASRVINRSGHFSEETGRRVEAAAAALGYVPNLPARSLRSKRSYALALLTDVIGDFPYRMALAGGWIDQPFVSRRHPLPPGCMVVVSLEPTVRFMDRAGMATSTRRVALEVWKGRLPRGDPARLTRELYETENRGRAEPSGSQDMAGLIYPGVSRLDYDPAHEGGHFPVHVETNQDPDVIRWVEKVIHVIPVAQRPEGYSPLGERNLDPEWIRRLGQSGRDCFDAIVGQDLDALGASMNECMRCWETILPHTVRHPALAVDLPALLAFYQSRYSGAMYSGCGGGYLYVASGSAVPGALKIRVRLARDTGSPDTRPRARGGGHRDRPSDSR